METLEAANAITEALGAKAVETKEEHGWLIVYVEPDSWLSACETLSQKLGFNYLASLTAVDLTECFELVAHIYQIGSDLKVVLKCKLSRDNPEVPTLCGIWAGSNWHERETHEMFGINFAGHPDLTHILLPDDWEGYPLRKDYVDPD